ncbi:hypothetical protein B9G99_08185 [Kushneria konosiri]|uniref:Uncharacterized protein n=2 Tax=Kushneria TaxID=504090 RepID=A0A240UMS6_9GAMM|nr:hypothetical protein B9G99_08185 [Kushneria konosiri]ART62791.1 hypothetical protein B9H00_06765 [Kushneria marisflavi]
MTKISLEPFAIDDDLETAVAYWVYIDIQTRSTRGVFIIGVHVLDQTFYLMEFQCRFEHWLRQVLSSVRHVQGGVQKLVGRCLGGADTFKHPKSKNEQISCETSVLNVFRKLGIARSDWCRCYMLF